MKEGPDIAALAALIGDPGRANILTALMDGRALTATELAAEAGVSASTASGHLARLVEGGLLSLRKQGRHKYFALGGPEVAAVLEGLMGLAAGRPSRARPGPKDAALREARVCYNHLAGTRGVQMFESLTRRGFVAGAEELALTEAGRGFVAGLGVDLAALDPRRVQCRACLDWSERRTHLAGSLGRALLGRFEAQGWLRRDKTSRALLFVPEGRQAFEAVFPL